MKVQVHKIILVYHLHFPRHHQGRFCYIFFLSFETELHVKLWLPASTFTLAQKGPRTQRSRYYNKWIVKWRANCGVQMFTVFLFPRNKSLFSVTSQPCTCTCVTHVHFHRLLNLTLHFHETVSFRFDLSTLWTHTTDSAP